MYLKAFIEGSQLVTFALTKSCQLLKLPYLPPVHLKITARQQLKS